MERFATKTLRDGGIERGDVVEMLIAAAVGTCKTGDSAAKPYRARLTAAVFQTAVGTRCQML